MIKQTPLYAAHQRLGAKLIEFGGWDMPVHYSTIVDEHLCVRRAAGLFDISHMGEIIVTGNDAALFLNSVLTNNVFKLQPGQGQYTLLCNPQGGVVDDLYLYRIGPSGFLLIVNASRTEADLDWLKECQAACAEECEVDLRDASADYGAIAVQGPKVAGFITEIFPGPSIAGTASVQITQLLKNQIGSWMFDTHRAWVARTGYTGEDGFEIFIPAEGVEALWDRILAVGASAGIQPCGLGARDTLRTEMGYPLYGHELDESTSPIEAGLGVFVDLSKGDFVGSDVLATQKSEGVTRRCVAFRMGERSAPPRPGYTIHAGGKPAGIVVSGTQSPSLNVGIGMGYVPPEYAAPGTMIEIEIRGRFFPAEIVKKPIYRKNPA